MRAFNSPRQDAPRQASPPTSHFRQPDNCTATACSAIALYEQELELHRATEAALRDMVRRESDLLREKDDLILRQDILARESEHRLLNGLQLIKSVLAMQSRGATNPEAAAQLAMAANRVATITRVHQHLHTLDKIESVEFKKFLEKLCVDLAGMAAGDEPARSLCVAGDELAIPRMTATPLGYIASEMITNSIKYAQGKIVVSLETLPDGDATLSVCDDGAGLPEAFDPAASKGLGMKIIAALVRQIQGDLSFARGADDRGTRFSVRFNARV